MTDFANLVMAVDSRQVKEGTAELDKLTAAGKRNETATHALARAQAQAKTNTDSWRASVKAGKLSQEEFNASVIRQKAAMQGVEQEYRDATRELLRLQQAQKGAAASAGAMRAGAQQLSYQIGDVATQFALGARPMQIFAAQGTQIVGALSLMRGTAGGLVGFLAGPWGIALTAAATVVGTLVSQLWDADEATKEVEFSTYAFKDAQGILGQVMDLTTGKINTQSAALLALASAQAVAGQIAARREQAEARAELIDIRKGSIQLQGGLGGGVRLTRVGDATADVVSAFQDGSLSIKEAERGLRSLYETGLVTEDQYLKAADAVTKFGVAGENIKVFQTLQDALSGDTDAIKTFLNETDRASKKRKETLTAEEKAMVQRKRAADSYIASLEEEVAKIGKSPAEIRQLEIARAKEAAATDAQRQAIEALNFAREEALSDEARDKAIEADRKATDALNDYLQEIENEIKLLGLVGPERELAALALEETAFKAKAAKDGIIDVEAAWQKYLATRSREINAQTALERDAAAAEILRDNLRELIGEVSRLGSAGGAIGGLLGILTGNTRSVGGPIGDILNIQTGTQKDANGRVIARTIGDEMRDIFKLDGEFGKTMSSLLGNVGDGLVIGQALFGQQNSLEKIGSAIGAQMGAAAGMAIAGPAGAAIGKVVGTIAGDIIGGALSATPRGSATIGNVGGSLGVSGTRGTSQARIAASEKSAGAIIDSLTALASELGATIDPTKGSVSIGIRKGNYRVDTSGAGRTKTRNGAIDFGSDAEAAALFAMQDLIRDGVLVGLRKGTETLLKNASDLEVGVQKALAFEGVFIELKALQDPLGAAMDSIEKEFDRLRGIFDEAGATAEEYAQLEELLTIKRREAIDDSMQRQIDDLSSRNDLEVQLLQLLGREEEALAQARQFELAGLESTLMPLQEVIYSLQDARGVMERFGPLAADLKAFRAEILGGATGGASFGFLRDQFRTTAASAAQGDADALGQLRGTASAFLDSARDNASSALEYQRAVGEVLASVDKGIFAADSQIEYAKLTIEAIDANRAELLSVKQTLATIQQTTLEKISSLERMWSRYDGDGLTVKTDSDTPIHISSSATSPVYVDQIP